MIESLRRIVSLTLAVGTLFISAATMALLTQSCTTQGCVATVLFGIPDSQLEITTAKSVSVSTAAVMPETTVSYVSVVLSVGMYLVTISVLSLIILEFVRPHFFRRLRFKLALG